MKMLGTLNLRKHWFIACELVDLKAKWKGRVEMTGKGLQEHWWTGTSPRLPPLHEYIYKSKVTSNPCWKTSSTFISEFDVSKAREGR